MTPERSEAILRALTASLDNWIAELAELEARCPGKVTHLLAQMKQTRLSLHQLLHRD